METSNHASQIRPSGPGRFILHELRLPLNTALLRTLSQESSTTVIHSSFFDLGAGTQGAASGRHFPKF